MRRIVLALLIAALGFATPAASENITVTPAASGNTGTSPCTAFGTTAGTCAQGGVITAGGPTGSATVAPIITYNAAGQLTAVSSATITPAVASITGLGSGVATALGNTAGGAGGFALASAANVASVSNSDGTLTISPTTGAVVASIALGHANTWSGAQTFSAAINETTLGSVFGAVNTNTSALTITNQTATLPAPAGSTNGIQIIGSGTGGTNLPSFEMTAYSGFNDLSFRLAGGSIGTPAATGAATNIYTATYYGYDLTNGFVNAAQFQVQTQGLFSPTNHGSLQEWSNTPLNSVTKATVMVLYQGLYIGSGTASSDPGIGNQQLTGRIGLGSTTLPVGQAGDVAQIKETDAAAAPGAGYAVLKWVAGTNAGSCKLIGYAGTSTTPVTIVDNIGSGC